jgi:predicted HTH domain antitoxin
MPTVAFELPEDQLEVFGGNPEDAAKNLRMAAAFHLCGTGQISTGKAARLAGVSYQKFLEEAARQKVDLYRYSVEEVKDELTQPVLSSVDIEAVKKSVARGKSTHS